MTTATDRRRWLTAADKRCKELTDRFKERLRAIAELLADQDAANVVDVKHVDQAFDTLKQSGVIQRPWWQRGEFTITVGGILFAIAGALPDFVPLLIDGQAKQQAIALGVSIALFGLGISSCIVGWIQNRK